MTKKFIVPLFIILIFTVILFVYSRWSGIEKGKEYLETTGIIEAMEVNVSPKVLEKIKWLCCREGDVVKKGGILIRLYNQELVAKLYEGKAVLQKAEAGYKASQASLENAEARVEHAKAEIKAADAEVNRARALSEEARDNFQRISELFTQGYAAKKDLDTAKAVYDTTSAQLNAATAKKESMEADLITARAGLRSAEAQLILARANIEEAKAGLKLAETQLRDTEIFSPMDGVIVYKSFEEGEMASPGKSIYTLYDPGNIWARVNIEETAIGGIRLGERVIIISGALPDRNFDGEVIEMGREAEFATQRDVTRGRQDIKTFRVKVAVKNHEGLLKPGMTVAVRFHLTPRPL